MLFAIFVIMTPEQKAILSELAKASNKFKELSKRPVKQSDYKELEDALTRIRLNYKAYGDLGNVNTVNGREGDVVINYGDIVSALGYVPSSGGGTNSNVLIDGGSFLSPNENVLIDGGVF